jgi:DUF4097 and DUF4098 domain-containing protein YvlB
MHRFLAIIPLALALVALAASSAFASELTFERDMTVSGPVDLSVSTGAGTIHLTVGPAGRVHIFGRVKSNWGGNDDKVHDIVAHPPIEQTGGIVRIGAHDENLHSISIDYEIQVPPDAFLNAATGSGNLTDEGVGSNARLNTGSGSIRATALHGGFSVETGSGSIYAEQTGTGDVKAETGSGTIELKNVNGGLRAHTGAGSIKIAGTPSAPWHIETGSGSVELWTGSAAFTLDAEAGSGSIHSDRGITTQGSTDRHHLSGKIAGGGPTVHIETGSGSIRVH